MLAVEVVEVDLPLLFLLLDLVLLLPAPVAHLALPVRLQILKVMTN
jgi:hypothetical protein